jgi:4-amino-4-deoxychorismate lyase
MHTLINGTAGTSISVKDRGLLYGDGAFETLAICNRQLVLLTPHLQRLEKASAVLRIPYDQAAIVADLQALLSSAPGDGICKVILTRGESGRGYRADLDAKPTRIVQYFDTPPNIAYERGITARVSGHRLSQSAQFSGLKHLNRLDQVMASFDLSGDAVEVLCLDQQGWVIEGSRSNIIAVKDDLIVTPSLDSSGVRGIMLDALMAKFAGIGKSVEFTELSLEDLRNSSELMFCNSVFGVWPVIKLLEDARVAQWEIGDITRQAIAFQHELFRTSI